MDKQDETGKRGAMDWYVGLQVIILSALPRDIDRETAEYWMENGDLLEERLRKTLEVPKNFFSLGRNGRPGPKIHHMSDSFRTWFLEEADLDFIESYLSYVRKHKDHGTDEMVMAGRDNVEREIISFTDFWQKLEKQPSGEKGELLTNGLPNIFHVRDAKGIPRAVKVRWHLFCCGWEIEAGKIA